MTGASEPFPIDFIGDVVCPWCFLGWARLKRALKVRPEIEARVAWRPFQLQFDIPEAGLPYAEFMAGIFPDPERRKAMDAHLAELGAAEGIDFRLDLIPKRPNTNAAHRVIRWAGPDGGKVGEAIMRAHFTEGRDVGDHATLAAIAGEQGMNSAAVLARLQARDDLMSIDQECMQASRAGVTGVPFMIFGQRVALAGAEAPERIVMAVDKAVSLAAQG